VGSVRKRSTGRWQARTRDPLTNRLVSLGTFVTKADADRALTLAQADQTRGAWVDPIHGRITLEQYARSWLRDHATHSDLERENFMRDSSEIIFSRHLVRPSLAD